MKNIKLKEHQERGISFTGNSPYSILAFAPRLGKSLTALEAARRNGGPTFIICPAHLVLNWRDEIRKWYGSKPLITAFQKGKDIYPLFDSDFCIISYELARKAPEIFEWARLGTLIIDEVHNLKSMQAKRSEFIHQHVYENSIKNLILLTGTPIKNRVMEFYSILSLAHYHPDNKSDFLERFEDAIQFADYFSHRESKLVEVTKKNGKRIKIPVVKWVGFQNVKELKQYLAPVYLRVRNDEVSHDYELHRKHVLISDTKDLELKRIFDEYFKTDGAGSTAPDYKVQAALQKVPFTINYIDGLLEEVESVVVLTDHIEPAKALARHYGTLPLTGLISSHKRTAYVKAFQAGNKGKVLVGTYKAVGEGQEMSRAKDFVSNDLPWVPGDFEQGESRILGPNQSGSCVSHIIMGSPQDKYIFQTLQEKWRVINKVT